MNNLGESKYKIEHRGIIDVAVMQQAIEKKNRNALLHAIRQQRSGFLFSLTSRDYEFHLVDRFALFPLFYTIHNGRPRVSQVVDELLPYLTKKRLHPEGFYSIGGIDKGGRTNYTPFEGILRIPPGHFLEFKNGHYDLVKYWSFKELEDKPYKGSYEEAREILGDLIKQGIDRCFSHSPNLAVHLSGGLDSGSITALLAQSKKDTIHAYAHVKPNAPDEHPTYEHGYLRKYVQYYPQISIIKSHTLSLQSEHLKLIPSAGNWHVVSHEDPEGKICQDLTSKKIPYILSGVGGDELASYGHGYQKTKRVINNPKEARKFMFRQIYLKRKIVFLARGILGKDGSRIDSIKSTLLIKPFTERMKAYHPNFRAQVKDLREANVTSMYWFPSSYKYRLETLDNSYFMIRSDIWNFLSRLYGIDYLFPLMDADLVEFCARLPREFFIGKPQRDMIKTGLKKYLPEDLLTGGKRPGYQPPIGEKSKDKVNHNELIENQIAKLNRLEGTLASKVYDIKYIKKQMQQYKNILNKISMNRPQTRAIILNKIRASNQYFRNTNYLNMHFEEIIF